MAQNNANNPEQELNEILRLRREKLTALKEAETTPTPSLNTISMHIRPILRQITIALRARP